MEVDGDIHDTQVEKDEARTAILEDLGYKVIRFRNEEVIGNAESVLNEIKSQLGTRVIPPLGARGIYFGVYNKTRYNIRRHFHDFGPRA